MRRMISQPRSPTAVATSIDLYGESGRCVRFQLQVSMFPEMVGGTIFHREMIQREISRALVLNLFGKANGPSARHRIGGCAGMCGSWLTDTSLDRRLPQRLPHSCVGDRPLIAMRGRLPFREGKQAVDLSKADIIVGVGRGIKEEKNLALVRELADVLGGQIAATRPVCDNGWLPVELQVGSSGQTVAPKVYIALGISGAIQHTAGMKGAHSIVAINKDPEAPIFKIADFAAVANLLDVVPPLIEEVKKAKGL